MSEFKGSFLKLRDFQPPTIHWIAPDRIVFKNGDKRRTKPDGSRPGTWLTASSNPSSADYNPNDFNRWAGMLRYAGLPAPDPVPEHPRGLAYRWPLLSPRMRAKILKQIEHGV